MSNEDKKNPKEPSKVSVKLQTAAKGKTYTEAELFKAIKYACEYQKATDYQTAGVLLIVDDNDLKANSILLLDELASDSNAYSEIELKDVFE